MNAPASTANGHLPTLVAYFDVSFMLWVLLGSLGIFIAESAGLSASQKGLMVAVPILSGSLLRIPIGLLSDRMLEAGVTPNFHIDEAKVVVVCLAESTDYRQVVCTTPLAQRFTNLDSVEDIVRASLKDRNLFKVASSEEIVGQLRSGDLAGDMKEWLDYHRTRYGW